MKRIKEWVMGILVKKYALGTLVDLWDKADGYRTQIQVAVAVGVVVLGVLGYIPLDRAYEIAGVVGGSAVATFLEKLRKHQGMVVKVQELVKKERAD